MSSARGKQPQKRKRLEQNSAPAAKRQQSSNVPAFPNFLLNRDVATEIFAFLDVKTLYNITMSSKEAMGLLRHEHVVRSALFQGGRTKTSVERLVPLIERRSIWIPSPIRMIRLVNGKRCERCNKARVNFVSESYGTFFCFHGCTVKISTRGVSMNKKWSPYIVDQPRLAKAGYESKAYIWKSPYTDLAGEKCGPLISMLELEGVMAGKGTMDDILKEKDAVDPHASAVSEIVKTFNDAKAAAEQRATEKFEKKHQASLDANVKRKKKLVEMIATLSSELGDVPWKEVVLAHTWVKHGNKDLPLFKGQWVRDFLHDFLKAPSKASKKKLGEVAASIKSTVQILEEQGFLDFSFLSESDAVEREMKNVCTEIYPSFKILESSFLDSGTLARIRVGDDLFKDLADLVPYRVGKRWPSAVVSSSVAISSDEMKAKAVSMAQLLWDKEYSRVWSAKPQRGETLEKYKDVYRTCVEIFPRLFQNTCDFLASSEVIAWKEKCSQGEVAGFAAHVDRVITEIWYAYGCLTLVEPLLQRDFEGVLKILFLTSHRFADFVLSR
jgi:hypothetical protein